MCIGLKLLGYRFWALTIIGYQIALKSDCTYLCFLQERIKNLTTLHPTNTWYCKTNICESDAYKMKYKYNFNLSCMHWIFGVLFYALPIYFFFLFVFYWVVYIVFVVLGQVINISGFMGNNVSIRPISLCHCSIKTTMNDT